MILYAYLQRASTNVHFNMEYFSFLKLTPTEIAIKLEITEDKVKELIASL